MRILVHQCAETLDAIALTGVIYAIFRERPGIEIDVLTRRDNHYIFANHPAVKNLMAVEDFSIPHYAHMRGHNEKIRLLMGAQYDTIIDAYIFSHYKHFYDSEIAGDISLAIAHIFAKHGLPISCKPLEFSPIYFWSKEDHSIVDQKRTVLPQGRSLLLLEPIDLSRSSLLAKTDISSMIIDLSDRYTVICKDNGLLSILGLNVRQLTLFFQKYCGAFIGFSRELTYSICSQNINMANRRLMLWGEHPTLNLYKIFEPKPLKFRQVYQTNLSERDMKNIFDMSDGPDEFVSIDVPAATQKAQNEKPQQVAVQQAAAPIQDPLSSIGVILKSSRVHRQYGNHDQITKNIYDKYRQLENLFQTYRNTDCDIVALDWAGIGDSVHSRLVLQHLLPKKILWFTHPVAAPLYRDDTLMTVVPGITLPYRDPSQRLVVEICEIFDRLLRSYFGDRALHISKGVCEAARRRAGSWMYDELWFEGCGIKRDFAITHKLTHNKSIVPCQDYFVMETAGLTFSPIPGPVLNDLTHRLRAVGITPIQIGSTDTPPCDALDFRGRDLYDTFAIMKGAMGMLGRSSGQQCCSFFLPELRVFEYDIPPGSSAIDHKFHPNTFRVNARTYRNIPYILRGRPVP